MKFLLFIILGTFLSCAHHHNKNDHHHHQFNKLCAYEVSNDHFEVSGKDVYQLVHEGETYYFSSAEAKANFEKDISQNLRRARGNWERRFRSN